MAATKITINSNGSIRVEGDFEIVDPQGAPFELAGRTIVSLCRCGNARRFPVRNRVRARAAAIRRAESGGL